MDIYMGADGGGGVVETTVDVEELEETVLQVDVSDSREEAPVLIDRGFPDGDDGEGGGGGVAETVDVEEIEETVLQADVSDSREEAPVLIDRVFPDGDDEGHKDAIAPHFDSEEAMDRVINDYLRSTNSSIPRDPHRHGRRGSGFYKVPADVRQQAGTDEAGLLYDPKYVNFRKISDLLLQEEEQDHSAQQQLSHYRYHLHSYVHKRNWETKKSRMLRYRETLKSFMQQLDDYQKDVNNRHKNLNPMERQLLWVDPPVSMVPQSLGLLFAVAFLHDLFRQYFSGSFSASEDPECAHSWAPDLWSDLLLLENQIPLFWIAFPEYLEMLFRNMDAYFRDVIPLNRFKFLLLRCELGNVDRDRYRYLHVLHFVHEMLLPNDDDTRDERRLRLSFTWTNLPLIVISKSSSFLRSIIRWRPWRHNVREEAPSRMKPIPTVSRLVSAGVEFKPVDKEGFVVEFKKGVLKLPRLLVSQSTKKMLANLIAWEKCHNAAPKYFINYAIFMDHLINTAKDVEILIHSKVFEHSLATDDDVKTTFDGLGQGLIYTKSKKDHERYDIFPKLTVDIANYYQSRPNKWLANLMQEYFKSPWTIISFIAALFLILLTTVQTFFSVYPYARPP